MSTVIDTFIAPPCSAQIKILYEDAHLLLIDKPSGLLSLSGKNPQNRIQFIIAWCGIFRDARWCIDSISGRPG